MRWQQSPVAYAQGVQDAQSLFQVAPGELSLQAAPTGLVQGFWELQRRKEMFYFIPCIKNGCAAGRWVALVVKGCARNKVG